MRILTYSDLNSLPFNEIKAQCRLNGIEVEGDKRRRDNWIEAYLLWQQAAIQKVAPQPTPEPQPERKVYSLDRDERQIAAQVANWAEYGNTTYDADDIIEVSSVAGVVTVHFVDGHFTVIDRLQFKAKVAEIKAAQPQPATFEEWEAVSEVLGGRCRYLGSNRWGIQSGTTNDAGLRSLLQVNLTDRQLAIAKGLIPVA